MACTLLLVSDTSKTSWTESADRRGLLADSGRLSAGFGGKVSLEEACSEVEVCRGCWVLPCEAEEGEGVDVEEVARGTMGGGVGLGC